MADATSPDPYRLPTHVRPTRYDVRLRPSLDDSSFVGSVRIHVEAEAPTDTFVLNAAELDITACTFDGAPASFTLDEANEQLTITASNAMTLTTGTLNIEFTGSLNDKLRGFYRSTYVDGDGNEQVIATTQMQATDCRRAFPCWDEPEYKAVFGITLDVDDDLTAISNGREIERTSSDGRTVIRFADTMVMSSYLVAFVVGRLEATEPVDVDGIPLRIVHVPGKSALTDFGLDVGAFCLRWFQEYYGIAYPSDKVDLVALPDFAAGAMENLGCITFRESVLLVDPATSTQDEQQRVADVVAHELAHMWFGDLVTMRWWNGIWLNEAFATFMEIAACDAYRPDWQRWTSFGLERSAAFDVDSLASTRPVEFEVRSPADCEGMFDVLTYQKGGALLRMLEQYLSPESFREGVNHYLRTHSYANTETNDLWDAIEATSGEPVRRIMDSWIWQPGYPILTASLVDGALELSQQRFGFTTSDDDTIWAIPVHVRNGDDTTRLLLDAAGPVSVPLADPDGAVVVNAGGHGFFRVAYDSELRSRLSGDVLASMSTLERYSLVDDAWSATVAGQMSAADLLDMLMGFGDERELAVWQAITVALRGLSRLLDDEPLERFREMVRSLVGPALTALGDPTDDESDLTSTLRGLLTSTLGVLGNDADTIARCREMFAAATDDPRSVDPELTSAATSVVAATGSVADYELMIAGFETPSTPQNQLRHLYALTSFDDADLMQRTCDYAMSDAVKTQNAPFVLRMAIANRHHGAQAWRFLRDHWADAVDRFPSNTISRMIDSVKLLTDPELVDEVQQFFAEHPIEQALKTQEQILERQRVNAALHARESAALASHVR
ncbi:M1 family metallopeptidase [Ilumatobacter coccineus]|uniref:Aminopeptidase n=1 Tax=Ilumatobacter coccineus (strain NBRC 103263 / KCTC 29153 / YM16-304) TaxID=1313172 RepID=A0A6C7DZ30_ILUCY|nr:M1 family metallopeptidase [Ilumatobacter coccineus]BAN01424.1 putative aminopeptidase [Ilumatobacter coccineus YM16-304]